MSLLILTGKQVSQTLNRLAYEVVERNRGTEDVIVFGILKAGARIGRRLARQIGEIDGRDIPCYDLDISAFRDDSGDSDSGMRQARLEDANPEVTADVTDKDVLLVDDVLFTGRTVRAALDAVIRFGRPRSIQLLVLIDRGHREYPIHPDYVGRTIATKHDARVEVVTDGEDSEVFVDE